MELYELDVPATKLGTLEGGEPRYGCCRQTEKQGHAETCTVEVRADHLERTLERAGISFRRCRDEDKQPGDDEPEPNLGNGPKSDGPTEGYADWCRPTFPRHWPEIERLIEEDAAHVENLCRAFLRAHPGLPPSDCLLVRKNRDDGGVEWSCVEKPEGWSELDGLTSLRETLAEPSFGRGAWYLNGYSVRIPEGDEKSHGYVRLRHGQTYSLVLANKNSCRCNVTVAIDGKESGTWRMESGQTMTLERPANEARLFTFYKADSDEGIAVAGDVHAQAQGLLTVEFVPEDTSKPTTIMRSAPTHLSNMSFGGPSYGAQTRSYAGGPISAGVTGLSGSSSQRFGTAAYMPLDHDAKQVINLRLVCIGEPVPNDPTPLRPVTVQRTPVPPPVG